jgi:hypothetical protein
MFLIIIITIILSLSKRIKTKLQIKFDDYICSLYYLKNHNFFRYFQLKPLKATMIIPIIANKLILLAHENIAPPQQGHFAPNKTRKINNFNKYFLAKLTINRLFLKIKSYFLIISLSICSLLIFLVQKNQS